MTRISGGVVVLVLALVAAACGDDAATTTMAPPATTTTAPAPVTTAGPAPATTGGSPSDESPQSWAEFEPAFMAGCSATTGEEQCACMFDEFQRRYEFADFFDWAYQAAEDDPRITEVADLCST